MQRARLAGENRPIASLMFLGPTGVGMIALFKVFGNPSILNGECASLEYVGHEDVGQLTEAMRRKLYAVLLCDEFEKAHRDISSLLQVLDEGYLTDAQGRKVDFRNTLVVLTTNLGAYLLA
ncbi:MAG: hypothetical protein L6R35_005260 [Caloplaca aegaea]|nr:MAG: hypothetical protein L6R35_005260 [Caloplaca aegaea]